MRRSSSLMVVVSVLSVGGCTGPVSTSAAREPVGVVPSVQTTDAPRPVSGQEAPDQTSAPAPASPPTSASPPAAEAPACRSSQLGGLTEQMRPFGPSEDGENQLFASDFSVSNVSTKTCYLSGWWGVELRGDTTIIACQGPPAGTPDAIVTPVEGCGDIVSKTSRVGAAVERLGSRAAPVVLAPGTGTTFSMLSEGLHCVAHPYTVSFTVPGDRRPLVLVEPGLCARGPISITAVGHTVR